MLGRPVSPQQCALAIAIPLTEEEFSSDLASPQKDLARCVGDWNWYERDVTMPLTAIASEVEAAGVTVQRRATRGQVADLCRHHQVVTIVAHWKYLLLNAGEVRDVARFHAMFDAYAAEDVRHCGPGCRVAADAPALAAALSAELAITRNYHLFEDLVGRERNVVRPASGLSRLALEEFYPSCFAHGRSLEMSDGLCTAWEFIEALPDSYDGIIDLSICHGSILGETVKRQRPLCNVIYAVNPASPDVRMTLYRFAIRNLAASPAPFEEAMGFAHRSLVEELRARADSRRKVSPPINELESGIVPCPTQT